MTSARTKRVLAIETSCDETAAAVATIDMRSAGTRASGNPCRIDGSALSSQIKMHIATNGVVPEVAARAHIQKISPIVRRALSAADVSMKDIDMIAVTNGPGLSPSLLIGVSFAQGLAIASGIPVLPVNHMLGHLHSAQITHPKLPMPCMNLIVSGGHTYLVDLQRSGYTVIGGTVDDAAGEAFDKVAKMIGLPYPGGPSVSRAAQRGRKDYAFPRPMIHDDTYDFSFSGLKTAVLYRIANDKLDIRDPQVQADIAFSFQKAVIDVLVRKTIRAARAFASKSIALSGGVAANHELRSLLKKAAHAQGLELYVPDISICTDNAQMIANAAGYLLRDGVRPVSPEKISVKPDLGL